MRRIQVSSLYLSTVSKKSRVNLSSYDAATKCVAWSLVEENNWSRGTIATMRGRFLEIPRSRRWSACPSINSTFAKRETEWWKGNWDRYWPFVSRKETGWSNSPPDIVSFCTPFLVKDNRWYRAFSLLRFRSPFSRIMPTVFEENWLSIWNLNKDFLVRGWCTYEYRT